MHCVEITLARWFTIDVVVRAHHAHVLVMFSFPGGATSKLLPSYPPEQRDQILDLLFKVRQVNACWRIVAIMCVGDIREYRIIIATACILACTGTCGLRTP